MGHTRRPTESTNDLIVFFLRANTILGPKYTDPPRRVLFITKTHGRFSKYLTLKLRLGMRVARVRFIILIINQKLDTNLRIILPLHCIFLGIYSGQTRVASKPHNQKRC